jgi:S-DNA-T family DNA segregation ATPase FtsK/SpoIIIE
MAKATRKKAVKNKRKQKINWRKRLQNPSLRAVLGILVVFGALFLLGAFISFLLNWRYDQNLVWQSFSETYTDPNVKAQNLLGKIGADLGHIFMYQGFGISAFLLPYFLFFLGLRLALHVRLAPLQKLLASTVFFAIWLPTALAFVAPKALILAGSTGYFLENWLNSLAGPLGSLAVLTFSLLIFLALRFRWTPEVIQAFFNRFKPKEKEVLAPEPAAGARDAIGNEEEDLNLAPETSSAQEPETTQNLEVIEAAAKEEPEKNEALELEKESKPEPASETESDFEIEAVEKEEELSEKELNQKVKDFGEYDPKLDLSRFKLPNIELLKDYGSANIKVNQQELEDNKNKIVETLNNYKIEISKIKATIGPTVTLYEIVPAAGVRISKIKNLEDDIALSLAALGIRIIAPIPGRGTIGIEVPSTSPQMVPMRNLIASEKFQKTEMELPIVMGKTISNETYITDLAKMPHLLMAGATGQGKSVGLNVILTSLLYKKHPSQVKFILVDPKKVELTLFNKIERHYLAKLPDTEEAIITDTNKVINTLNSLCIEMDDRYELLKNAMVRNIKEYNTKFINRRLNPEEGHRYLPYIVLVIDEFADLIMTAGKEVETPIARLAQLARAIGIHLIVATQRPSVNVITGIIKANFPARAAFRVTSKIDSRTILDTGGAEQLIGKGDMLLSLGQDVIRLQCAFVDTPEVEDITDYIGAQQAYPEAYQLPEYKGEESDAGGVDILDPAERDALFEDAARVLVIHQQGSASLLQRKLKLGYNRAGRIIDQLEAAGIIGPFEGSKARQVLIPDEMALEQLLKNEQQNS